MDLYNYLDWFEDEAAYLSKLYSDIMYFFGEERRSRLIAKKIFEHRPIEKVQDLVTIIKKCTPPNKRNKTMARVFQSFRIAVNNELENLKTFMGKYINYLKIWYENKCK